ncbi:MAG TPA: penicillin-binding transpeptidase domain-containing protein, partial [Nevskiaceae bacterium]|nr:penicillin-binding transpeptidase domain-containing protein [Nevskiaceae bacterium]
GPEYRLADEWLKRPAPDNDAIVEQLNELPELTDLPPAVVLEYKPDAIKLLSASGLIDLPKSAFAWANIPPKKPLVRGDIVRIKRVGESWKLSQVPQAQGAFVAVDPHDGAILALAGGYDFFLNKFNHVIQARRQVGSGFKPYLYCAAMAYGFTPASVFLDAPVVFDDPNLEQVWKPENYDRDYNGPMRLREALVQSRNLVSIRVLQAIGLDYAREYVTRFGLPQDRLPRDLTMALGTAVFTPLEMARGYATIANGGFLVEPYFIDEIRDAGGAVLFKADPKVACPECIEQNLQQAEDAAATQPPAEPAPPPVPPEKQAARTVDPQIVWLITSMMHDVTVRGTGAAVNALGRTDLAGKTGTTNDETDAWFNGFQKGIVGISWVGFDQPTPLGKGEVGGRASLPIWMDFMKSALKNVPQETLPRPPGLVDVRINPKTGKLALPDAPAIFETVQQDRVPETDNGHEEEQEKSGVEDLY